MPIKPVTIPLDVVGKFVVAENSQRVNRISVTRLSAAAVFRFDLGNSQETSAIDRRCVVRLPRLGSMNDKEEGIRLIVDTPQPGLSVDLTVSYQRAGDPPNDGIEIISAS